MRLGWLVSAQPFSLGITPREDDSNHGPIKSWLGRSKQGRFIPEAVSSAPVRNDPA